MAIISQATIIINFKGTKNSKKKFHHSVMNKCTNNPFRNFNQEQKLKKKKERKGIHRKIQRLEKEEGDKNKRDRL